MLKPNVAANLIRRSMSGAAGGGHGHKTNPELWRKIFLFGCVPTIVLCTVNTVLQEIEHHKHHEQPPFVPYEYLYIRRGKLPWGDGVKSLFHNPVTNALPDGYEKLPEDHH